jgi:drug/metabolite transporter (DMT)-like permease
VTATTNHFKGMIIVIIGAALWGISGTVAQTLFQDHHITVGWLVDVRLLGSGIILLLMSLIGKERHKVWAVWKDPKTVLALITFAILGLVGVQYTYLASIAKGNAAVATLLQYLAPVFIAGYFIVKRRALPNWAEWLAILLALVGTFLLLTNGSTKNLHIPLSAVIWGVLSAVALAFYTIYPGKLLVKWGAPIVIGWGMTIGGIALSFWHSPWQLPVTQWTVKTVSYTGFVVIFGTLIAFYLYLESQRYITAKESSLLACTEPLTAVLTAILWLGVPMGLMQWLGAVCVLGMMILLAVKPESKPLETVTTIEAKVKTQ